MLQLHMWAFKDIFATQKVGLGGVAYIYMVYVCVYVCIYIGILNIYNTYIMKIIIIRHTLLRWSGFFAKNGSSSKGHGVVSQSTEET